MGSKLFEDAYLKVERAREILDEIKSMIEKEPPFSYVLETDIRSHERATLAKTNSLSLKKVKFVAESYFTI
jgi:hypothetical protein